MKILMSAFACSPIRGSEPGVGWNWAREMSKFNEVWVVTRSSNRSEIEMNSENENIKFIYLSIPFISLMEKYTHSKIIHFYYYLWQRYIVKYLKKLNEKEKFQIIHHVTYNEFRNPGYLWKIGVPFILGPIGGAQEIENELIDYCEGNWNKKLEKIRSFVNNRSKKSKYLAQSIANSSKIIVANNDTARFLDLPDDKYEVMLETGVKKESCNYIVRKENNKIRILWVGNLIYIKGFKLLIDAFSRIANKDKYEVIVIGEGKLKSKYIELLEKNGMSNYFSFKGKLSYADTLNEYRYSDIFLFTSLRDTSGNVVLEAMSNCLPVISLNHHGAADMLDENCAIKININNKEQVVDDLVKSIELLGNDYNKRIEMGISSFNRIQEKYIWENKGVLMQQIYNKYANKA
ncbi:glycosyltransferase family 4 protein [Bacillus sp. UNCCL81]|uniref:glycosyltransferase family 4 protein n=1 Tax=Bacillus sp. UNCCL81 TaxID=1502755 RepID=UPI0008DEEB54|nr:glycosyltransferase family 4 protein [Bacillus sp. UNCCL81]SFD09983.1 Glycosyltransferase involved in cell wall bisynthesis [Bacillus sp. UNCCL81]